MNLFVNAFGSYLILGTVLISVLVAASSYISHQENLQELGTGYECGFVALEEARGPISINFYLVSLAFVLFDLEIILLFPWALVISWAGHPVYYIGWLFIVLLVLGFVYELNLSVFEWL